MKKRILSLLLAIVLVLGMVPTAVFAAEDTGIIVYMTVFNKGEFCKDKDAGVMWQKPVTVLDTDADGKYSLDEALAAAHAACYAGGVDGYATEFNATFGSKSVTALWGQDAEASGYYRNHAITNAVDQEYLSEGDRVTAFLYYDGANWSDRYSFFTESSKTVVVGTEFELTLNYSGYDSLWNPATLPVATAPIGVYNMTDGSYSVPASLKGENIFGTIYAKAATDIKGVAKLSFTEPGTYYVTAQYDSSNYSTYTDELGTVPNYLVPPVCVVTVVDAAPVFSKDLSTAEVSYKVGDQAAPLSVEASAPDGGETTYQWYSASDAESEGTAIDGATESSYAPSTETAGTTYYYVVASNTAEHTTASSRTPVKVAENIPMILETISGMFRGTGSDWNVVDMAAFGMADQMDIAILKENAEKLWNEANRPSTDYERVAIALSAAGIDATAFELSDGTTVNLIERIANLENLGTINGYIFALNAYDSGNYTLPENAAWTREAVVEYILSKQLADNGWALFGSKADPDVTAMAITALSLYPDMEGVSETIENALDCLSAMQTEKGGFKSWGQENSNSSSMVIIALTAMDMDAASDSRFVKNGNSVLDALLSFKTEENTFGYTNNSHNGMATEQGFRALVAYTNWLAGDGPYYVYDFADGLVPDEPDVVDKTELARVILAADALNEEEYTTESWAAFADALAKAKSAAADDSAEQDAVNEAAADLRTAMDALVPAGTVGPDGETITVSFRLIGDTKHGEEAHSEYVTWIPTMEVEIPKDGTVYDAFAAALEANGMDFKETQYGYIGAVQAPAALDAFWLEEFDNGVNSGWMYTVNGSHPGVGLRDYTLEDGDRVVWHYTDDYEAESGGWEEVPDEKPEKPVKPVNVELREAYETTAKYLQKLEPITGSVGGEWLVLGLARSEFGLTADKNTYYEKVVEFVKSNINDAEQLHRTKSTDNSRIIVALTAIGRDPTNVEGHNLLEGLTDLSYLKKQGLNGPIWALIAFDTKGYEIPGELTREDLIHEILGRQLSDGGWSRSSSGTDVDVDITAMALYALAPYVESSSEVKAAVEAALDCLSAMQNENGGFAYGDEGENAESCAQVITALSVLGIDADTDPRFIKGEGENAKRVIDAFLEFYVEDGGFRHNGEKLDQMATEQAFYAMAAYYRNLNGEKTLFDMSDVEAGKPAEPVDKSALEAAIAAAEKLDEADYTEESWKNLEAALVHAKAVLATVNATQAQVDEEVTKLNAAVAALVKASKPTEPTEPSEPTVPTEPEPTDPKPTDPKPTDPNDPPKTGDETPIVLWTTLMTVSCLGIAALYLFGLKKKGKYEG